MNDSQYLEILNAMMAHGCSVKSACEILGFSKEIEEIALKEFQENGALFCGETDIPLGTDEWIAHCDSYAEENSAT